MLSVLSCGKLAVALTGIADHTASLLVIALLPVGAFITVGETAFHEKIGKNISVILQTASQPIHILLAVEQGQYVQGLGRADPFCLEAEILQHTLEIRLLSLLCTVGNGGLQVGLGIGMLP
jgi:hypothetical protein